MLDCINTCVKVFQTVGEMLRENNFINLRLRIIYSRCGRQYIQPTSNKIGALIVGEDNGKLSHRDIILSLRDRSLKKISCYFHMAQIDGILE